MTAVVIQHWLVLTTVWSDPRVSLTKATRLIRDELSRLIPIATQLPDLIDLLTRSITTNKKEASERGCSRSRETNFRRF